MTTISPDQLAEWCAPVRGSRPSRTSAPGDATERVLRLLTSSRFRKGSLAAMDVEAWRAANRPIVLDRIRRGEPVAITLMAYPFKVPNPCKVGARILPDLAELASLMYLRHLHESVQYLHPPGIRLTIIHDGQYLNGVFGIPPQEVLAYEEYFARMLRRFHLDTFIRTVNFNALLAPQEAAIRCRRRELVSAARRWATSAAHAGEQLKAFQKTLGMMNLRRLPPAERNALAGGAPPSRDHMCNHAHGTELRRAVDRAMRRYFLLDLILHRFDPRPLFFPDAIHATTKIRRGRLALWLMARGHGELPWHGVGALEPDGRVRGRRLADLARSGDYEPVFLEGESTPFFYARRSARALGRTLSERPAAACPS